MTFPNIPNVTPSINISRADVINLLLASVAFEELGLAHVINAEAEKIQASLGTLEGTNLRAASIGELLSVNNAVNDVLRTLVKKEMLLQFKLEDILRIPTVPVPPQPEVEVLENTATVTANFEGLTFTDTDSAFYHRLVV